MTFWKNHPHLPLVNYNTFSIPSPSVLQPRQEGQKQHLSHFPNFGKSTRNPFLRVKNYSRLSVSKLQPFYFFTSSCGSDFFSIPVPDPGSRDQKSTGSWIRIRNTVFSVMVGFLFVFLKLQRWKVNSSYIIFCMFWEKPPLMLNRLKASSGSHVPNWEAYRKILFLEWILKNYSRLPLVNFNTSFTSSCRSNVFKIYYLETFSQCCGSGKFIPDPNFSIPDPGSFWSRIQDQKDPGSGSTSKT